MPAFNNTQLIDFFTSSTQMGLTVVQRTVLQNEGLADVTYFALKNVRQCIPTILCILAIPEQGNMRGTIMQAAIHTVHAIQDIQPVLITMRLISRLYLASIAYYYYICTASDVTSQNVHYDNVHKGFFIDWEVLEQMGKLDTPELPTLSKINKSLKWCESSKLYFYATFGVRKIPLFSVILKFDIVTPENGADPDITYDHLQQYKATRNSGLVLGDSIARANHSHHLFKFNDATVFGAIGGAIRGSVFATTTKTFAMKKMDVERGYPYLHHMLALISGRKYKKIMVHGLSQQNKIGKNIC